MPFSGQAYDPQTLAVLTEAFNSAWQDLEGRIVGYSEGDIAAVRKVLAMRIMAAANDGERDPEVLKVLALRAVGGPGRE